MDRRHKLIRRYHVSDAALHDSQAVDHLLMRGNTGAGVWADAAYRSEEMEGKLLARGLKSHIHRKGRRGKPLGVQAKGSTRSKSTVRSRVEHVFGAQSNDMGGTMLRTIGLVRARAKIGMKNRMDAVLEQERRPDWVSSFDLISHVRPVLSDSGGILEDAPTFGTPVVVMRQHAERMEGVHAGFATLSDQGTEAIEGAVDARLGDEVHRSSLRAWPNPYGDDQASARILVNLLGEPCEYFHG